MTFTLSNGAYSMTFPLDPQEYSVDPRPRTAETKTLGGKVVQLLGWSTSCSFSGYIHGHMLGKQDAYAEAKALMDFAARVARNQRDGVQSHISWPEQGIDMDCAIGDLTFSEALDSVGYTWSLTATQVSKAGLKTAAQMDALFAAVNKSVGYVPGDEGWHGGDGDTSRVKQVTGFLEEGPAASTATPSTGALSGTAKDAQDYAKSQMSKYGWSDADFQALVTLWTKESNWDMHADNPTSDAYGIPQGMMSASIHPEIMPGGEYGDYRDNYRTQVDWGLKYIKERYGSPSAAWAFWQNPQPNPYGGNWY